MLNYDKIIIDTSNIFYRVAAFHLKDQSQEAMNVLMKNNAVYQYYVQVVQNFLQATMGKICLLFDPLKSNGSISTRQKIKEGYKSARDKNKPVNQLRIDTLEKLYSKFLVDSPNPRIEVYHDFEYEADDYAEKLTETGKCLLVTADEDFCRYLETGRVEMLKSGLTISESSIFTAADFEKKYGFKPTIASVVFWKALYGDVSDNIVGSFKNLHTKVIEPASEEAMKQIKRMGEENSNISAEKRDFFEGVGNYAELKRLLILSNTSKSYEKLLDLTSDNFSIIESMLPRESDLDIEKFCTKVDLELKKASKPKFTLNGVRKK